MRKREELTGHYAGCALRAVKSAEWTGFGMRLTLECGHTQVKGGIKLFPASVPCLDSPCYQPVREFTP